MNTPNFFSTIWSKTAIRPSSSALLTCYAQWPISSGTPRLQRRLGYTSTENGSNSLWRRRSPWATSPMTTRSRAILAPPCNSTQNLRRSKQYKASAIAQGSTPQKRSAARVGTCAAICAYPVGWVASVYLPQAKRGVGPFVCRRAGVRIAPPSTKISPLAHRQKICVWTDNSRRLQ